MTDYPLSTISSKKIKHSSRSLFERSACQTSVPSMLNRAEYAHILSGERVFIELYYQGRVMQTAYNEWIDYMGGLLYKRLNPRVTIFLTNTDTAELNNILDRVKRTCPACRVVSILWFQHCFQAKSKVPFDQYLLDMRSKEKEEQQIKLNGQEETREILQLEGFLDNIAEDIEVEYQQFFKRREVVGFEIAVKNGGWAEEDLIRGRDIDLGQHPNRKKNNKPDNNNANITNRKKKVQRTTTKDIPAKADDEPVRSVKSMTKSCKGDSPQNQGEKDIQQKELIKGKQYVDASVEVLECEQNPPFKNGNFKLMMEKYLNSTQKSKSSAPGNLASQQRGIQIIEIKNHSGTMQNKKQPRVNHISNSKRSVATHQPFKNSKPVTQTHRSNHAVNNRYKDLKKGSQKLSAQIFCQLQLLRTQLVKDEPNRLVVITDCQTLIKKIQFSNNKMKGIAGTIQLKLVNYYLYRNFMKNNPPAHKAYYLLNPTRFIDRPMYYALESCYPAHPKLIDSQIVDDVIIYNESASLRARTPLKTMLAKLTDLRELQLPVCQEVVQGKRVAFLQTDMQREVARIALLQLGAVWVNPQEYLLSLPVDIVVTRRGTLRNGVGVFMCEDDLWKAAFPMKQSKMH